MTQRTKHMYCPPKHGKPKAGANQANKERLEALGAVAWLERKYRDRLKAKEKQARKLANSKTKTKLAKKKLVVACMKRLRQYYRLRNLEAHRKRIQQELDSGK